MGCLSARWMPSVLIVMRGSFLRVMGRSPGEARRARVRQVRPHRRGRKRVRRPGGGDVWMRQRPRRRQQQQRKHPPRRQRARRRGGLGVRTPPTRYHHPPSPPLPHPLPPNPQPSNQAAHPPAKPLAGLDAETPPPPPPLQPRLCLPRQICRAPGGKGLSRGLRVWSGIGMGYVGSGTRRISGGRICEPEEGWCFYINGKGISGEMW